ncbi:MAG: hypothetical protein HYZ53_28010 [Planctomycetes bacterium]|nr:hypothetical protein [Planctomycetota bacterium]
MARCVRRWRLRIVVGLGIAAGLLGPVLPRAEELREPGRPGSAVTLASPRGFARAGRVRGRVVACEPAVASPAVRTVPAPPGVETTTPPGAGDTEASATEPDTAVEAAPEAALLRAGPAGTAWIERMDAREEREAIARAAAAATEEDATAALDELEGEWLGPEALEELGLRLRVGGLGAAVRERLAALTAGPPEDERLVPDSVR